LSYLIIGVTALATAFLTLFSGFGLGTLLMPAFALFFPLPVAIASTAVVHGANNLFKVSLLYKEIDKNVFIRFGIPAMIAAVLGALSLSYLALQPQSWHWNIWGQTHETSLLNLVLGSLILIFAIFDLLPIKSKIHFQTQWLPLGGLLSGFFGGLSGHQGAFRSMFLLKCGLTPKSFVATQSSIATVVDMTRLIIYMYSIFWNAKSFHSISIEIPLVIFATVAAFSGTLIGRRLLEKTKMPVIRGITASLLLLVGSGLILGLI
jgi:hypothetical protein